MPRYAPQHSVSAPTTTSSLPATVPDQAEVLDLSQVDHILKDRSSRLAIIEQIRYRYWLTVVICLLLLLLSITTHIVLPEQHFM